MRSLEDLAEIADGAAQLGHDLLLNSRLTEVRHKSDRDTVTNVDLAIEREIRAYLSYATPEISFYSEELDSGRPFDAAGPLWILDPIDGTANYTHGLPLYAVSLALLDAGRSVVAVIDVPQLDQRYAAVEGHGAHSNGGRIRVSDTVDLSRALVTIGDYAVGSGAPARNARRLRLTATLAGQVERVRMLGSAAIDLAWLADGRVDGAIILNNNPWDTAAGVLVAREAGADVLDTRGTRHQVDSLDVVATTPGVTTALRECVRQAGA